MYVYVLKVHIKNECHSYMYLETKLLIIVKLNSSLSMYSLPLQQCEDIDSTYKRINSESQTYMYILK